MVMLEEDVIKEDRVWLWLADTCDPREIAGMVNATMAVVGDEDDSLIRRQRFGVVHRMIMRYAQTVLPGATGEDLLLQMVYWAYGSEDGCLWRSSRRIVEAIQNGKMVEMLVHYDPARWDASGWIGGELKPLGE